MWIVEEFEESLSAKEADDTPQKWRIDPPELTQGGRAPPAAVSSFSSWMQIASSADSSLRSSDDTFIMPGMRLSDDIRVMPDSDTNPRSDAADLKPPRSASEQRKGSESFLQMINRMVTKFERVAGTLTGAAQSDCQGEEVSPSQSSTLESPQCEVEADSSCSESDSKFELKAEIVRLRASIARLEHEKRDSFKEMRIKTINFGVSVMEADRRVLRKTINYAKIHSLAKNLEWSSARIKTLVSMPTLVQCLVLEQVIKH